MGTSVLIRKNIDLLTVRLHWRYLLCAPIEEVKVPKLETNSLSGLSDELVRTVERFWVGSGVRWREQLLATVPEKRECKETILAENFFLRIFHLPRNLFPWMAKLHSRLFPSTRPSGTPIFVKRAAKDNFSFVSDCQTQSYPEISIMSGIDYNFIQNSLSGMNL